MDKDKSKNKDEDKKGSRFSSKSDNNAESKNKEAREARIDSKPDKPEKENKYAKLESTGAARKVMLRTVFAQAQYRKLNLVFFICLISSGISCFNLYTIMTKPIPPRYIAITPDGKLLQEKPLTDDIGYEESDILEFSVRAIKKINTYDYLNYKYQWQESIEFFTDVGWKNYVKSLYDTQIINTLLLKKSTAVINITSPPTVIKKGTDEKNNNFYTWYVKTPVSIFYSEGNKLGNDGIRLGGDIYITITRVKLNENPKGIGIAIYRADLK